ncbi:MAG: HAD-IA family hydrolase [Clostridiales bacterium]|nr:HAD-IA family hydrolase [Clostridiales bacterium]
MSDKAVRPNKYDILLCDADDTVLDFQKAMRTSIIDAARAVGIQADDQKIVKEFGEASHIVWRKLEDKLLERDALDTLRFSMLKDRLGVQFNVPDMSEAFLENMKKTRFLLDGATEFLSAVRARGIKVYILTNGLARVANERLKALDGYIDGAFISDEIGYNKPDQRLFDYVFAALGGVDKSRTLMLGDSVNSDIRGGVNSGVDTCLFDPSGSKQSDARYTVRTYDEVLEIL